MKDIGRQINESPEKKRYDIASNALDAALREYGTGGGDEKWTELSEAMEVEALARAKYEAYLTKLKKPSLWSRFVVFFMSGGQESLQEYKPTANKEVKK